MKRQLKIHAELDEDQWEALQKIARQCGLTVRQTIWVIVMSDLRYSIKHVVVKPECPNGSEDYAV